MSQETQESTPPQLKLVQQLLKEAEIELPQDSFRHAAEIFLAGDARKVILYYLAIAVEKKLQLSFMPENLNKAVLQEAYQRGRMDLAAELLNLKAIVEAQASQFAKNQ